MQNFFISTIDDAQVTLRLGLKSLGFNICIIHYLIYLKEFSEFEGFGTPFPHEKMVEIILFCQLHVMFHHI